MVYMLQIHFRKCKIKIFVKMINLSLSSDSMNASGMVTLINILSLTIQSKYVSLCDSAHTTLLRLWFKNVHQNVRNA